MRFVQMATWAVSGLSSTEVWLDFLHDMFYVIIKVSDSRDATSLCYMTLFSQNDESLRKKLHLRLLVLVICLIGWWFYLLAYSELFWMERGKEPDRG